MPVSRNRLTLLPGGLTPRPTTPAGTRPGGSTQVVDAVLTVQVGGRRGASALTLTRGVDGRWRGRLGPSREPLAGEVLSVDALLDAVLQRAVGHPGPASDSRRRV
ncbi:MAG: hypothetical protein M3R02_28195 [Chloroflexota bacterium]|nr:hypothetical protein [Chloroflexota bacterium]